MRSLFQGWTCRQILQWVAAAQTKPELSRRCGAALERWPTVAHPETDVMLTSCPLCFTPGYLTRNERGGRAQPERISTFCHCWDNVTPYARDRQSRVLLGVKGGRIPFPLELIQAVLRLGPTQAERRLLEELVESRKLLVRPLVCDSRDNCVVETMENLEVSSLRKRFLSINEKISYLY